MTEVLYLALTILYVIIIAGIVYTFDTLRKLKESKIKAKFYMPLVTGLGFLSLLTLLLILLMLFYSPLTSLLALVLVLIGGTGVVFHIIYHSRGGVKMAKMNPTWSLTPNQYHLLKTALERGYYNKPRDITLRELARYLGVAAATLSEALKEAERKVVLHHLKEKGVIKDR